MAKPISQLDGNQTLQSGFDDAAQAHRVIDASQLIPEEYDEIDLTYTGDNVTTVVYKLASVTVATLTLTYSGDKVTNVIRT